MGGFLRRKMTRLVYQHNLIQIKIKYTHKGDEGKNYKHMPHADNLLIYKKLE